MNENNDFMSSVHKYGRLFGIVICILVLSFPFIVSLIFGVLPNWSALIQGAIAVVPMYWAVGIIEMMTYIPMLGAGGAYLSFVTGNISNLKLPCAIDAMEKAEVKANTEEGEVISTISIAVSSIVTTLIIIIGVLLIIPLSPVLESPVLGAAFDQLLPALFGGLAVAFVAKNPKIAIAPIILMLILFITIPALNASTVGIMVPVGVVFTLIYARILYKKGML